jgi:rubrerythrin
LTYNDNICNPDRRENKMYKTDDNLKSAFAVESQAYCRYTFFASKAEAEGFPEMARLFRAAAQAEIVHARNHFSVMGGVGTIKDNLLAAATDEHYEITRVYPPFIEKAQEERADQAQLSFTYAYSAEKVHNELFEKALEAAKNGQTVPAQVYHVCQVCGNIITGEIPRNCSICKNTSDKFEIVK